eukprot:TRINITY_DN104368_c0_g1_i1.p1 TRINITY_DN104368_c0_g1~~TRINITY_DN104368_c0_g1_i1.p1  ORF type:complete len:343 (+),score=81.53 TRINITY_DN104368_c0_g1_i1:79-1107(+)
MAPVSPVAAAKKPGPNDRCTCGSGAKAKKCCFKPDHTPCQSKGEILPGSSDELLALAKDAAAAGEHVKAVHFYTMAIDMLAKGMSRDSNGRASDADLQSLNKSSGGQLAELLSGRSHSYLRQKDLEAAIEDAETCARADPSSEKGQLRLLVALEAAGVDLRTQLKACENAVEACPGSEPLVARKWRLKKVIAESAASEDSRPDERPGDAAWTIADTRRLADDVSNPRRSQAAVDLGRSYAAGAHGLEKDLQQAARYLRLGCEAGDVSAQRDLGLVLLDLGQPAEAAEELRQAAQAGDEEAAVVLQQLAAEAQAKEAEARAKLKELAELGDPRAARILEELSA